LNIFYLFYDKLPNICTKIYTAPQQENVNIPTSSDALQGTPLCNFIYKVILIFVIGTIIGAAITFAYQRLKTIYLDKFNAKKE